MNKYIFNNDSGSIIDEVIASMQKSLQSSTITKNASINDEKNIENAIDLLNKAANILDNNGLISEANILTQMLLEMTK